MGESAWVGNEETRAGGVEAGQSEIGLVEERFLAKLGMTASLWLQSHGHWAQPFVWLKGKLRRQDAEIEERALASQSSLRMTDGLAR